MKKRNLWRHRIDIKCCKKHQGFENMVCEKFQKS